MCPSVPTCCRKVLLSQSVFSKQTSQPLSPYTFRWGWEILIKSIIIMGRAQPGLLDHGQSFPLAPEEETWEVWSHQPGPSGCWGDYYQTFPSFWISGFVLPASNRSHPSLCSNKIHLGDEKCWSVVPACRGCEGFAASLGPVCPHLRSSSSSSEQHMPGACPQFSPWALGSVCHREQGLGAAWHPAALGCRGKRNIFLILN